jgi:hypothetical protein
VGRLNLVLYGGDVVTNRRSHTVVAECLALRDRFLSKTMLHTRTWSGLVGALCWVVQRVEADGGAGRHGLGLAHAAKEA